MRLIDADALCSDLLNRWRIADTRKEELIRAVMADIVTPIIVSQSTIEERKKGTWVPFEYGDDTWHKCTACGVADNYIDIVRRPNNSIGRLVSVRNFCPNCGADMRGVTS